MSKLFKNSVLAAMLAVATVSVWAQSQPIPVPIGNCCVGGVPQGKVHPFTPYIAPSVCMSMLPGSINPIGVACGPTNDSSTIIGWPVTLDQRVAGSVTFRVMSRWSGKVLQDYGSLDVPSDLTVNYTAFVNQMRKEYTLYSATPPTAGPLGVPMEWVQSGGTPRVCTSDTLADYDLYWANARTKVAEGDRICYGF